LNKGQEWTLGTGTLGTGTLGTGTLGTQQMATPDGKQQSE